MDNTNEKRSAGIVLACVLALALFFMLAPAYALEIAIPQRLGLFPLKMVKAVITVDSNGQLTFTIKPSEAIESFTTTELEPGSQNVDVELPGYPSGVTPDRIVIVPPQANLPEGDPGSYQYEININLTSNRGRDTEGNCINKTPDNETFSITASGANVTGACLSSVEFRADSNCFGPGSELYEEDRTDPTKAASIRIEGVPTALICGETVYRPAVDVVLVLDKSGSMSSAPLGGTSSTKIISLHEAVETFISRWDETRVPGDQIGVVLFDSDPHWLTDLGPFEDQASMILGAIDDVEANGSTSMGNGLFEAVNALFSASNADNGHRKVILLMSNGKENTARRVRLYDTEEGTVLDWDAIDTLAPDTQLKDRLKVQLSSKTSATEWEDLEHEEELTGVYAVTIGTGTAVKAAVNQGIALATGGFYLNKEDDAVILKTFFTELLQNFIKFYTWETVRIVSANVSRSRTGSQHYTVVLPITSTSKRIAVDLAWNRDLGNICLTVDPPGENNSFGACGEEFGAVHLTRELPLSTAYDITQNWTIKVEVEQDVIADNVPFHMIVMTDDVSIKSELGCKQGDYEPGDEIPLNIKVTDSGRPVRDIERVIAQPVKPGESIGDLLSDSQADTFQPAPDDEMSNADAKLHNELQTNPQALLREKDTVVTLLDNGSSDNGDEVAGDGMYSALYKVDTPGHYNFLLAAEGCTEEGNRFSRQQLRTVYVRGEPDPNNTNIQTSIQHTADGNTLTIDMTPRTKFGHRMGPGWANYFWFTAPGGQPFKAEDNLDGTYTALLSFSGDTEPPVSVHFLRVAVVIEDSVTPDKLPVPLDDKTILIENVPRPLSGRFAVNASVGAGFPQGSFSNDADPGVSLNMGLEYLITPTISAEAIFGYHRFSDDGLGDDLDVYQFSLNGRYYFPPIGIRPFINAGVGLYNLDPGDTEFGFNVGAGAQYDLLPQLSLEAAYNYHNVDSSNPDVQFSTLQIGLRYQF